MRAQPSRLRKFLWQSVQIKFSKRDLYDKKALNSQQLQSLLSQILDDNSQFSTGNILRTVFKMDQGNKKELSLLDFTQTLLHYLGEIGLKTFNSLKKQTENELTKDQFYNLFISSYRCLNSMRVRQSFIRLFFDSINSARRPSISISDYQRWIKDFISNPHPLQSIRKCYYLKQDDFSLPIVGDEPIIQQQTKQHYFKHQSQPLQQIRTAPVISAEKIQRNRFKFSRMDLAEKIVKHTITVLAKYDINRNNNFEVGEIELALKDLLKGEEDQVFYGVANDFRYNMEKVEIISYEAIAKFVLSCHIGQIILKRMHTKKQFIKSQQRKIAQDQFVVLFTTYLSVIKFALSKQDILSIFSQIDRDSDLEITYAEFLQFLKMFFRRKQTRISINIGTSTIMDFASEGAIGETIGHKRRAKVNHKVKKDINIQWRNLIDMNNPEMNKDLTELIRNQLLAIIVRLDKEKTFEKNKDALIRLLFEIFEKGSSEVEFAVRKVLKYKKSLDECMTYDELVKFLIEIQMGELTLQAFKSKKNLFGTNFKINFSDFCEMMRENCYYIGLDFSTEDLQKLFTRIDKDDDGIISVNEYLRFIRIDLAHNVDIDNLLIQVFDYAIVKHQEKEHKKAKMKKELAKMIPLRRGQSKQVKEVVTQLYTDLKAIFDKYDVDNDQELNDKELQALLRGVLKMNTQHELDYIFWNMFRIDKKGKGSVEFEDFSPFILKHSAEITLQRFHSQQKKGKTHINLQEFKHLMNEAYHFISAIKKDNLHIIFDELDKDKDQLLEYKEFLGWILKDIAPKIR